MLNILARWISCFVLLQQECPSDGDNNKASSNLHHWQGHAKKTKKMRPNEVGPDHQKETVNGDLPRQCSRCLR